jgi:hypothetical protein
LRQDIRREAQNSGCISGSAKFEAYQLIIALDALHPETTGTTIGYYRRHGNLAAFACMQRANGTMAVEFATIKLSFISLLGVQSIRCIPTGIQVLVASLVAASASLAGLTRVR